ncbi:MAG: acetate--CoA ligase family protein [Deltaproteobacteria bacterium]|nr:acetate--CoA ligase family protein [Deltaproteobacteria bacterium]
MSSDDDISTLSQGLDAVMRPRSVAVIGASRREGSIGRGILRNLIEYGFEGPVYPVNAKAGHVLSLRAWPTVEAIDDPVDLAVIVVPSAEVPGVVEACARKGVRGLVMITAGFREVGTEGAAAEAAISEIVRRSGMRMIGPNCMGVINTDPVVRLNASFAAAQPHRGNAAFASQSGALGEVVLATANAVGLGVSQFVSLGNKADVSGNDLLSWWATDPQTQLILLYLESFGNPRRFAALARQVTREHGKPILAVKSGRTVQGARAASSHTGSLAGSDRAASSLLAHCGVIRCNTVGDLFNLGLGFANQPLPQGDRVAVLTNAGGPGIMATDACVHAGLQIAEPTEETVATLAAQLPPEASVHNPVDMIASATAEQIRGCTAALLADPGVDALLVIFVSPVVTDPAAIARGIVFGIEEGSSQVTESKPVLACFMGRGQDDPGIAVLRDAGVPNYPFPEGAVRTLAAMASFQRWRSLEPGKLVSYDVDRPRAESVIRRTRQADRLWMVSSELEELLAAYGIDMAPSRQVDSPEEAIAFAEEVGYPVVLKLDVAEVVHKSDVGGVKVDLRSAGEIKGAFWDIKEALASQGIDQIQCLVQKMITGGREIIIGAVQDAHVGHLLMFGIGGVFVELMEDVAFRVHPITDTDAERCMREIKGWPLLAGHRGSEPVDLERLKEVLLRVSQLIGDFPEIAEMELNPFIARPAGKASLAVDARVRLDDPDAEPFGPPRSSAGGMAPPRHED